MGHAFALGGLGSGTVIVLILLSLVFGALFLMLSFRVFERFTPAFGSALMAIFVSFAALVLVDFVLSLAFRYVPRLGIAVIWVLNLAIMLWIVRQMLRRPNGETLSYFRTGVVVLGSFGVEVALLAVVWFAIRFI